MTFLIRIQNQVTKRVWWELRTTPEAVEACAQEVFRNYQDPHTVVSAPLRKEHARVEEWLRNVVEVEHEPVRH